MRKCSKVTGAKLPYAVNELASGWERVGDGVLAGRWGVGRRKWR